MYRAASLILGTLLVAGLSLATPQAATTPTSLRCTLTGKKIEKCCCEQRDSNLYCTLAKKAVEKCCCEPAETRQSPKKS